MAAVNPRKVVEGVVDLVVYAPVGVAATVVEELPGLVAKGKTRLVMARTIGQFAVAMGRQRVEKAIADRRAGPPAPPSESPAAGEADAAAASEPQAEGTADEGDGDAGDMSLGALEHGAPVAGGPQADGLAIPGYDSLAASQVVQRLAGLSPAELEAVRDYEEATRGRRTILGRISQLTASQGEPAGG